MDNYYDSQGLAKFAKSCCVLATKTVLCTFLCITVFTKLCSHRKKDVRDLGIKFEIIKVCGEANVKLIRATI
jgi:hypothetical protein